MKVAGAIVYGHSHRRIHSRNEPVNIPGSVESKMGRAVVIQPYPSNLREIQPPILLLAGGLLNNNKFISSVLGPCSFVVSENCRP